MADIIYYNWMEMEFLILPDMQFCLPSISKRDVPFPHLCIILDFCNFLIMSFFKLQRPPYFDVCLCDSWPKTLYCICCLPSWYGNHSLLIHQVFTHAFWIWGSRGIELKKSISFLLVRIYICPLIQSILSKVDTWLLSQL